MFNKRPDLSKRFSQSCGCSSATNDKKNIQKYPQPGLAAVGEWFAPSSGIFYGRRVPGTFGERVSYKKTEMANDML